MNFRYGLVIGMDYLPTLRAMLVAPTVIHLRAGATDRENWNAVVLHDEPHDDDEDMGVWEPGQFITVSPMTTGVTLIESPEGNE